MRNRILESAPVSPGCIGATGSSNTAGAGNLLSTRRSFMRRGALMAAGGLVVGGAVIPGWARWLGEQMDKLQPKPRVEIRLPPRRWIVARESVYPSDLAFDAERTWTYSGGGMDGLYEAIEDLKRQMVKQGFPPGELRPAQKAALEQLRQEQDPWAGVDIGAAALAASVWFGLKEA